MANAYGRILKLVRYRRRRVSMKPFDHTLSPGFGFAALIEINAERRLAIIGGARARIGAGDPGRTSQRG